MVSARKNPPRYAEFFCGGGMVRAGLGADWTCALANDINPMKCETYTTNWGGAGLHQGDVAGLDPAHLRQPIDLYWASSPCQDFSLAGKGRGLSGARSGVFWAWADLIRHAVDQGFGPRIIAFENVTGLMTRNAGRDFAAVLKTFQEMGYRFGAMEIDAARFLPQSRPRLFVVAVREGSDLGALDGKGPSGPFHTAKVQKFASALPARLRRDWIWWHHAAPAVNAPGLVDVLDDAPDTKWLTKVEVKRLQTMMSPPNLARLAKARTAGGTQIGMLYKRGRPDGDGNVRQRAEIRFDGLAGCLRTPGGGSSRQTIVLVEGDKVRARLISKLEMARLMGLDDSFAMPQRYNAAYQVAGDGVAVPVVRYLDQQLFQPLLDANRHRAAA